MTGGACVAGAFVLPGCRHRPPEPPPRREGPFTARLKYGYQHARQFGDLRMPAGDGPHPVAMVIHGGFWLATYELSLMDGLCDALQAQGIATWNVEYRGIGHEGGGWPGTLLDVAAAADFLRALAMMQPLDLTRVVTLGHSAGGHLALWLAARRRVRTGVLASPNPLPIARVVALAPLADLRAASRAGYTIVEKFLGGTPKSVPERYADASPAEHLPLAVRQVVLHGTDDQIVAIDLSRAYVAEAAAQGDDATLVTLDGVGHFEPIDPTSTVWPAVLDAVLPRGP